MAVNTAATKQKLLGKTNGMKGGQAGNGKPAPNQLEETEGKKKSGQTIGEIIEKMMPTIIDTLPKHIPPERMSRLAISLFKKDGRMQNVSTSSFLAAVLQSVQLGLEPNTALGEAYIIPYGKEANFQIGYKGIIKMAYNTGQYAAIYAHEVYKNDEFKYQLGLNKDIYHVPADEPQGDPIYYYGIYKLKNGGYDFAVWSRQKIQNHALKYSKALNSNKTSVWETDFDSMAKKTVLLDALKYAPKSISMAEALESDRTQEPSNEIKDVIDMEMDRLGEPGEENWA